MGSMEDYVVDTKAKLGEGADGVVCRGMKKSSKSPVAVKRSKYKPGLPHRSIIREIGLLQMVSDDPHFIKILHSEKDMKKADDGLEVMNLVLEYADTDLDKCYKAVRPEIIPDMKEIMFQLCKGLSILHSRGIMHRDIKPPNLLLDKNRRLKIADLGAALKVNVPARKYTPLVGTPFYMAPEILLAISHYTMAVDMWSAGCVFADLARGEQLFFTHPRGRNDELGQLFRILGKPSEDIWPGVTSADLPLGPREIPSFELLFPQLDGNGRDLIQKMLCLDPGKRITAQEAMAHPYFDDLNKEDL